MTEKLELERFIDDAMRANRESESQSAVDEVLARTVSDPARVVAGLGEPRAAGRSEWDPETLSKRPFDLESARAHFREGSERFETSR